MKANVGSQLRCASTAMTLVVSLCDTSGAFAAASQKKSIDIPDLSCALVYLSNEVTAEAEKACLNKTGGLVFREGEALNVRFDNGKEFVFNKEGCEAAYLCKNLFSIKYRREINQFILTEIWGEAVIDTFISKADGEGFELRESVQFSPKGHRIVSVVNGDSPTGTDYNIKIYDLTAGPAQLVFSFYDGDAWEFDSWTKEDAIKVRVVTAGNVANKPYSASLLLIDDRWRLVPDKPIVEHPAQ